ncbi:MAG: hypothetical protein ACLUD2_02445 [Clostridium sp.]
MPLIFDDSFVLYDEVRLRTALKWLKKAYPGQIIIFTCHQRGSDDDRRADRVPAGDDVRKFKE